MTKLERINYQTKLEKIEFYLTLILILTGITLIPVFIIFPILDDIEHKISINNWHLNYDYENSID